VHIIRSKQVLSPTITRYVIEAPLVAGKHLPGNFVIVRVAERGERIPLTVVETDPEQGTITLIVQAVGKTTRLMSTLGEGDSLTDVVGPLGHSTPMVEEKNVFCIGGGVGTAELLPITRGLKARKNTICSIIGARSSDLIILENEMRMCSDHLLVTSDDGSYGRKGLVTEPLYEYLTSGFPANVVYAIGPLPMMRAVCTLTREFGVKTYVSLNAIMVDGTGMCGGCRVTIGSAMKFACVDGPEFDGHQVDFDELIMRNRTYVTQEQVSDRLFAATQSGMQGVTP